MFTAKKAHFEAAIAGIGQKRTKRGKQKLSGAGTCRVDNDENFIACALLDCCLGIGNACLLLH